MQSDRQLLEGNRLGFLAKDDAEHRPRGSLGVRCLDPVEGDRTVESNSSISDISIKRRLIFLRDLRFSLWALEGTQPANLD